MNLICRLLFLTIGLGLFLTPLSAQEDVYRMELGVAVGGSFYMGDANYSTPFKNMGVAGGVMARYLLNLRMALKGNLIAGKISGNTTYIDDKFPGGLEANFKRNVYDLGVQFEYNFWGYNSAQNYIRNQRITPYILGGLGFTFAPEPAENVFTANIPIGVGVKYKLAHRINIGCEWTMRFSLSDKLDVTKKDGLQLNDPFLIKGKGFKNKDSYSFTVFFITYDLFPRCKGCNRE
ncbi:hypothetical protein D0T50_06775 [Bacteroides sp. 214]|uniref:type IX secretion system protein PorG n=1 Tax=Bacteroides sp. 214 TaxID=2302935 RepID=UPI0013CFA1AE|nr:DUF6089 family protein [Bacteroides sp. 214]NDW12593.1 hypothetical protein [Bacteroides sp. 214]